MASKSIPTLNPDGTNFLIWKKALHSVLDSKDISYVINDPKNLANIIEDSKCRDHIIGSIDNDLSVMYQHQATAKSLMAALTGHFKTTQSRRISLYRQYFNRQMAVNCSIGRHIAQMGATAAELEAAGVELSEMVKAMALIDSLPKSWRDAVLARTDLEGDLTVEVVIQQLRSVGDRRAIGRKSNIRDIQMMVLVGGYLAFLCFTGYKISKF